MQRYTLGLPQGLQIFRVDIDDEHMEIVNDTAGQGQLEVLVQDRGRGGVDQAVGAGFMEIDIMDAVEAADGWPWTSAPSSYADLALPRKARAAGIACTEHSGGHSCWAAAAGPDTRAARSWADPARLVGAAAGVWLCCMTGTPC